MPEKIKLTYREVNKVHRGLRALDGVLDGKEIRRFDFDMETHWQIVTALMVVEQAKEAFDRMSERMLGVFNLIANEAITESNRDEVVKYNAKREEMLDTEIELELRLFDRKKIEAKNQKFKIPPGTFVDLWPIISKEEDAKSE